MGEDIIKCVYVKQQNGILTDILVKFQIIIMGHTNPVLVFCNPQHTGHLLDSPVLIITTDSLQELQL